MEVANASLYEGATRGRGDRDGGRISGKRRVVISRTVHPDYRQVVQTYLASFRWSRCG